LIRSVDPVEPPLPLPRVSYVTDRGPFSAAHDQALMGAHAIDAVIAKNSGGGAGYGEIGAAGAPRVDVIMLRLPAPPPRRAAPARALSVDVIMLRRPAPPDRRAVETLGEVVAWLDHAIASATARLMPRGV